MAESSRLSPGEEDFSYDLDTVLRGPHSHLHLDGRRLIDRLLRYETVLQKKSAWQPLDFSGRRVIELGCGPLAGIGPIGVYLGADSYQCVEPSFRREVIEHDEVWVRFFLPLYQQLDAIYDRGLSFDQFRRRVLSNIQVHTTTLDRSGIPANHADIVITNGVLQHILPIEQTIRDIRTVSGSGCRQFHNVNFTDHVSPPDRPFAQLYNRSADEYFKVDSLLNLKRASDYQAMFEAAGIDVDFIPYYSDSAFSAQGIDPYWRKYADADLAVQIGFFVS